ncbi:MAG TPA: alpha/beta-type small acid-soluble spore protein [Clostridiales bacterium]|nr:alpha/beta-type small acid-soluble spore protein [Clostridiales bacterium]
MLPTSNQKVVPAARDALNNMKFEIANEIGINLKPGYNGDLTAKQAGHIGGQMTRRLVAMAQQQMSGQ